MFLALGSYFVGCGGETDPDLEDSDSAFVLAQEDMPQLSNTEFAADGSSIPTSLPIKLTNGVTLQSCNDVQIMTGDDPTELTVIFKSGYTLRSNTVDNILRKECQLHLTVTGASNTRFVATVVLYSGSTTLRSASYHMKFESEIYWQSKIWQIDDFHADLAKAVTIVDGPRNSDWDLSHPLAFEQTGWGSSECLSSPEDSDQLVLSTRLLLQAKPPSDLVSSASLLSIRSAVTVPPPNGAAAFTIKVNTLPCTPTK